MKNGGSIRDRPNLVAAWEDYKLATITGWTFEEIDEAPALRSDWILAIDRIVATVEAEQGKQ